MNPIREAELVSRIYRLRESGETWEFTSSELQWSLSTLSTTGWICGSSSSFTCCKKTWECGKKCTKWSCCTSRWWREWCVEWNAQSPLETCWYSRAFRCWSFLAAKVVGRHEYVDPREVINDIDLDEVIYILSALYPERGERMMLGFLRARNMKLSREQVRAWINCNCV